MSFAVGPRISLPQPPRWVPIPIRIKLKYGGALNQVGWFMLGLGSLIAWALQIPQATYQFVMFQGTIKTTPARVISVDETNAKENERRVYIYYFEAKIGEKTHQGYAYETGKSLQPGQRVTAEYPQGRPDLLRIKGKRSTLFGWPALIFAAVPIIGFFLVLFGYRRGRRWVKLLANGEQTTGKLVHKEGTSMHVNNATVFKLTFEFRTETNELQQATVKTHETSLLQDDAEEILFYLPEKPSVATLMDHLPGSPHVDEMGEFRIDHPFRAWLNLIFPLLTIFGNAAFIYYRYFA